MGSNTSMIDGHTDSPRPLYVVFSPEESTIYGVFDCPKKAKFACEVLINNFIDDILSVDPRESGVDISKDLPQLQKECADSLSIHVLGAGINRICRIHEIISKNEL
jgi:hypothetical protein